MTSSMFQSTRPQGARLAAGELAEPSGWFQSTRPQGARLLDNMRVSAPLLFQSTRPQGARQRLRTLLIIKSCSFQSTRPQGARLIYTNSKPAAINVSIHAPAGGATFCR